MSKEHEQPAEQSQPDSHGDADGSDFTEIDVSYDSASEVATTQEGARMLLPGNLHREPVNFSGGIKHPLRFREALAALHAAVSSDFRYSPKDRTAYTAFMRMRRESAGMNAWQAQQAYFDWLLRNDPLAWIMLDPIVSVHPDQISMEVFSKDEGVYASIAFSHDAFQPQGKPTFGVTNIDFSQSLLDGVMRMRSYRDTQLAIGQDAVKLATSDGGEVLDKKIKAPGSWLRGFLQVQSAATLPTNQFQLAPIELYNILRQLRMHADQKGKPRGLRIELTPGEFPIVVLEPWETVLQTTAARFTGTQSKVVRIWGRRRLMLVSRLLPFVEQVEVNILGSGLPSFWVLRMGDMTATLGMTGFTAANWSKAVSFDLLLPRDAQPEANVEKIVKHLKAKDRWLDGKEAIGKAVKLKGEELVNALRSGCQQGVLMYDIAAGVYRLRPLTEQPLDMSKLEFRNEREKQAYDLVARKGAVKLTDQNRIHNVGLELTGKVTVAEDKREYRPQMLIALEGHVGRAECTCQFHRTQGLKNGPCAHLIALRLIYGGQDEKRGGITTETRTFSKRTSTGERLYQLTLDRERVKIRWGKAGHDMRLQQLRFNTVDAARGAYLGRVDELVGQGYLDQSAD